MCSAALFVIAETWRQPRCTSEGEDPENRLFRAESSSREKSWRKLTCILPSERTQSESTTILYDYNYKALWKSKMTSDF